MSRRRGLIEKLLCHTRLHELCTVADDQRVSLGDIKLIHNEAEGVPSDGPETTCIPHMCGDDR